MALSHATPQGVAFSCNPPLQKRAQARIVDIGDSKLSALDSGTWRRTRGRIAAAQKPGGGSLSSLALPGQAGQ